MKRILVGTLWATTLALSSVKATTVIVQEVGITPYEIVNIIVPIYSGPVYAGVNQLLVDHVLTNGFCIDPFHFSVSGEQQYNVVDLTLAPKGANMTPAEATIIRRLWALAFPQIGNNAARAAGLQIAMWMVVGGSNFHLTSGNDYGASLLLATVTAPGYNGPSAYLIALTGPGQDYVMELVTDGGTTLSLFGLAIIGLAIFGLLRSRHQCSASDGMT
jgi:hypothetical protein